jgi:hypothetical protein
MRFDGGDLLQMAIRMYGENGSLAIFDAVMTKFLYIGYLAP